jgi:hypothetical protein
MQFAFLGDDLDAKRSNEGPLEVECPQKVGHISCGNSVSHTVTWKAVPSKIDMCKQTCRFKHLMG